MNNFWGKLAPSYLFNIAPSAKFEYYWIYLIFFLLIIIISFWLAKKIKKDKVLKVIFKKLPRNLRIVSIFGLIFILSRVERVPYLAMRIWLLLAILFAIYVLIKAIYLYQKKYPQKQQENIILSDKNKYLPQPKNKKRKK